MVHAYISKFLRFLFSSTDGNDFPASGLFLTYLGLCLMDGHGQPALLYLVPCTLGNKFLYLALGRVIFLFEKFFS